MSPAEVGAPSLLKSMRERSRSEIESHILDAARGHLEKDGASGLSLRAIARELGVSSSAVYRYVASRDELLTKLMISSFDSLGEFVEAKEARVARDDLFRRWSTACRAIRQWALSNRHEYALIYGSRASAHVTTAATIAPAFRASDVLVRIVADAALKGAVPKAALRADVGSDARTALAPARSHVSVDVPDAVLYRAIVAWAALFGIVSFEVFGQLHNVVAEKQRARDAFFAECVGRWADQVGIS